MLRLFSAATLLAAAHAQGKCGVYTAGANGGSWSVDTAKTTAAACSGANEQFFAHSTQESAIGTAPKRKTWWTKRMTKGITNSADGSTNPVNYDRLFFGGRPTVRDLKMMYEQGFSAVHSVWPFPDSSVTGTLTNSEINTDVPMPTGAQAKVAANEAGLLYGMIPFAPAASAVAEACVDADSSGDDCSAFVAGCATSCPTGCDYTAPVAEVAADTEAIGWQSEEHIDYVRILCPSRLVSAAEIASACSPGGEIHRLCAGRDDRPHLRSLLHRAHGGRDAADVPRPQGRGRHRWRRRAGRQVHHPNRPDRGEIPRR